MKRLTSFVLALFLAFPAAFSRAATGTVMPSPYFVGFTDAGVICAACKLYTYVAGSSTPLTTYNDADLDPAHANANPVVLDSAGRATVFLSAASYKFVLKTSADVTIWTQDDVSAVPYSNVDLDITGTAGEDLTAGNAVFLTDGSSGTTAGRWYKSDADAAFSSTTAQAIGMVPADIASGASGSIRLYGRMTGLSGLTPGAVYYVSATAGALTSTAPTNQRAVGAADSSTTLVLSSNTTPTPASATVAGIVNLSAQQLGTGVKTFAVTPTFYPGTSTSTAAKFSGVINTNTTSTANSGASEEDLIVYSLPANVLSADGRGIRITAWGEFAADTDAKQVLLKFGSATLAVIAFSGNNALVRWRIVGEVLRTGSNAQVLHAYGLVGTVAGGAGLSAGSSGTERGTATETDSGAISVGIRCNADNANDVVQKALIVEVIG